MSNATNSGAVGSVEALAGAVMRGVVNALGARLQKGDAAGIDRLVAIMRAETKAFIFGQGAYSDARSAIVGGSLHGGYGVALVVAECVSRFLAETSAACA